MSESITEGVAVSDSLRTTSRREYYRRNPKALIPAGLVGMASGALGLLITSALPALTIAVFVALGAAWFLPAVKEPVKEKETTHSG